MPQITELRAPLAGAPGDRIRRVVVAGLVAAALASVALLSGDLPSAHADELSQARARQEALDDRIAAQKRRVAKLDELQAALKTDIGQTTTALRSINADLSAARKQVGALKDSIAAIQAEYDRLVIAIESLDVELARLRAEQREQQERLRGRLVLLADRIRDAYDADRTSMLEIILSARSFTELLTEANYALDVAEQDQRLAEQIKADREMLATLEASVETTREQTDQLRMQTATQKRGLDRRLVDLEAAQAELRKLERATERELAKQRATVAKLAKDEAALRTAIAKDAAAQQKLQGRINDLVREQEQSGKIPSDFNGTFVWPHAGRITQEFGCTGFAWEPPLGDCANFHRGIDIAAARWTKIRAAADGVVVFAGPNPYDPVPKAWIVIIAHSSTLRTWYAHVDNERRPTVRAGQSVRQGQVIAYVGSTGRSTGYHTDWRVELRGKFVNPRLFL